MPTNVAQVEEKTAVCLLSDRLLGLKAEGKPVVPLHGELMVLEGAWPQMFPTIWGTEERYIAVLEVCDRTAQNTLRQDIASGDQST